MGRGGREWNGCDAVPDGGVHQPHVPRPMSYARRSSLVAPRPTIHDPRSTIHDNAPELSVVMPCLNEADTIESCIRKAQRALAEHRIAGEIIVADNGMRLAHATL